MKKKMSIFLSILLVAFGIFIFIQKSPNAKNLVLLRVRFFPFLDQPIMKVDIEDKKYSLLIDLGSSHPIDLCKRSMDKIKDKKAVGVSNYIGIRGKIYPTQGFKLPKLKIQHLIIEDLVGFEENLDFFKDAKTSQSYGLWSQFKDQVRLFTVDGRIGWMLFKEGTVLFDFPHSTITISRDLHSLINKERQSLDGFTQVPFEIQKWGLVLNVETDLGLQKFLLDTGSTRSILRSSLQMGTNKLSYTTKKFKIGNHDFEPWKFLLLEYNNQMKSNGILGVDFFKKHMVCLDFQKQIAYIKLHESLWNRLISMFFPKKKDVLAIK